MAANVTLGTLRSLSRQRADMESSGFVQDPELDNYINLGAQELYDLLVSKYEDYYTATPVTASVTATESITSVALPATFYKLRGVDVNLGEGYQTIHPFPFEERNRFTNSALANLSPLNISYRLRGNNIDFYAPPGTVINYRLWFIPAMTRLVNSADVFDSVNGWEEYIVLDAAIRMKTKEESDTRDLRASKQEIRARIEAISANRDPGAPEKVTDVYAAGDYWPFRRL